MRFHHILQLAAFCVFSFLLVQPVTDAREMSKAGAVFQEAKDGVVTLFSGGTFGSGFLVSNEGLILTNYHVIRGMRNQLRVRFGPGTIVSGTILETDKEHDLAVVWVNLENVPTYKVLKAFNPPEEEPLVLVGEKVIALGSPIDWKKYEKIMTSGVVGKFDSDIINHDAAVNKGNSGGPLVNFDGKVVGLNTFGERASGQAITGAVPIYFAQPLISRALKAIVSLQPPLADLLPDYPSTLYPIEQATKDKALVNAAVENSKHYQFDTKYFNFRFETPIKKYAFKEKQREELLKERKKRARKKDVSLGDEELSAPYSYYELETAVVKLYAYPKPKMTTGSKVRTGLWLTTLALGAASGSPTVSNPQLFVKKKVKKDFQELTLVSSNEAKSCEPVNAGRVVYGLDHATRVGAVFQKVLDQSFVGVYEFLPACFKEGQNLSLKLNTEGINQEKELKIPLKTIERINQDFKPYWSKLAYANEAKKSAMENASNPPQPTKQDELETILSEDYVPPASGAESPNLRGN